MMVRALVSKTEDWVLGTAEVESRMYYFLRIWAYCLIFCLEGWPTARDDCLSHSYKLSSLLHWFSGAQPSPIAYSYFSLAQLPVTKPRASHTLGKRSTTEPTPSPHFSFAFLNSLWLSFDFHLCMLSLSSGIAQETLPIFKNMLNGLNQTPDSATDRFRAGKDLFKNSVLHFYIFIVNCFLTRLCIYSLILISARNIFKANIQVLGLYIFDEKVNKGRRRINTCLRSQTFNPTFNSTAHLSVYQLFYKADFRRVGIKSPCHSGLS